MSRPWLGALTIGLAGWVACEKAPQPVVQAPVRAPEFLVPDVAAESIPGLGSTDTLLEVPPSRIPTVVAQTFERVATTVPDFRSDPDCTQYFMRDTLYVALVRIGCDPTMGYLHGDGYVVVKADGGAVTGLIMWPLADVYFKRLRQDR